MQAEMTEWSGTTGYAMREGRLNANKNVPRKKNRAHIPHSQLYHAIIQNIERFIGRHTDICYVNRDHTNTGVR